MTSTQAARMRSAARGVNARATSRRSRLCSAPSMLTNSLVTRSQMGPDVIPCTASPFPFGLTNLESRSTARTRS